MKKSGIDLPKGSVFLVIARFHAVPVENKEKQLTKTESEKEIDPRIDQRGQR